MRSDQLREGQRRERGAATLIVIMVLFFVMSMVAAYTSRNLIFEQKTSANQLRSTLAAETAEAGLQWALGLLNSARVDAQCLPSTDVTNTTFRQRYLDIDGTNGSVLPRTKADGTGLNPSCVFTGAAWACSCPSNADPAITPPTSGAISPAFRVRFVAHTDVNRRQLVRIEVNACTSYNEDCLKFVNAKRADNEARAFATAYLTLKGALTSTPTSAITARGVLNLGSAAANIYNSSPKSSGITVNTGGAAVTKDLVLHTVPGSPVAGSVVDNDTTLQFSGFPAAERGDAMFVATFGMARSTYRDQPGTVVMNCGGSCTASQLQTAAAQNPGRILWVPGNVSFDAGGDVGSPTEPIAVVATGNIQFSSAATNVYGIVYSQAATWTTAGTAGTINGAAVGEGDIVGNSTTTVSYDASILDLLRYRTGSFVVVPGTWRDF